MKKSNISSIMGKKKVSDITIIFLSFLIIVVCVQLNSTNSIFAHTFLEMINVFIGFTAGVLGVYTYEDHNDNYYLFVGSGYFSYSFLNLIDVFIRAEIKPFYNYNLNIFLKLMVMSTVFISISYILANVYMKKKVKLKPYRVITIYSMITVFVIIIVLLFNDSTLYFSYNNNITNIKVIGDIINIVLLLVAIIMGLKNKEKLWGEEIYLTFYSLLSFLFYYFLFIFHYSSNTELSFQAHIFKTISFMLFYSVIMKGVVENPYEELYLELQKRNNELNDKKEKLEILTIKLTEENVKLVSAHKRIRNDEENYRTFIEFLPDAVFMIDEEKLVFSNKAGLKLLNVESVEELKGRSIYQFIHPNDYNLVVEKNKKVMEGKTIELCEEKLIRSNNTTVDVEVLSTPYIYENRYVVLSVARDITQRKIAAENELLLKEAIESERIRNEFFANLSHELRTPINVIYSAVQVMDYSIKESDISNLDKYNNVIKQNSYRLTRLINNLIDITKINAGFFDINPKICNIVNIVEDVTMSIDFYVKCKNMNLIFDTEVEDRYVNCDPDMIERIMLNLLSNAVKFGKKNGNIEVNIYDREEEVLISVKDDGIGIAKEKQSIVFDRFVQVDKSLSRNCEGSGIGLSLVKALVEIHNGKITLNSEEGKGSEFIISLPVIDNYEEYEDTDLFKNDSITEKVNLEFSDIYF